jgi:diguanylate cyclase (GGDEF)-like protein
MPSFRRKTTAAERAASESAGDMHIVTSVRRLTAYYVVALLAIGCIALTSHIVEERSLESGQGIASVINSSGRQRMLSQRIEGLAEQYHRGDPTAREDLLQAIDEFEKSHQLLAQTYLSSAPAGDSSPLLHELYFGGAGSLDRQVRTYILNARQVSSLAPDDPRIPALLDQLSQEARSPLLNALNRVVTIHQQESERKLANLKALQWTLLAIMGVALALEAMLVFRPLVFRIVALSNFLLYQANADQLTGVNNRRGFLESAAKEFNRFQRYRRPLTVIALDIDHFKQVNDTLGHEAGDTVLNALGAVLASSIRPIDIVGRIGGEEFALILPETPLENAVILAERLRGAVQDLQIPYGSSVISVTASFGVAAVEPGTPDIASAMRAADKLLYAAKHAGRNRVVWEA